MDCTDEPKFNTELSVFPSGDGNFIVHLPLQGRAFKVDSGTCQIIEKIKAGRLVERTERSEGVLRRLRDMRVLGNEPIVEPQTPLISQFVPLEATLIFTESCNLGCSYCYASSTTGKSAPMSEKVMRAAVDLVSKNAAETESRLARFRYIGGGEPTAEWRFLESTTRYIRERCGSDSVRHFIRLITNGTLLTEERVAWLASNIQFVTLSFDILPELQEARPYANGKPTHSKLLEVVRNLCAAGIRFHLRTTISAAGAGRLEEMVQYVHQNTGAKSIRFEPLSAIGRSVSTGLERPLEDVFVESFKAAYRLGKQLGIDVTCKMFTNYQRRSARFCDAEFSVTPSGRVTGCHRYSREEHDGYDQFLIGQFDGQRFVFDIDRLNSLRKIDVHRFSDCSTCIARWNCAGGCLSARMNSNGISEHGPLCNLTRELLKFSIEEKVNSNDRTG